MVWTAFTTSSGHLFKRLPAVTTPKKGEIFIKPIIAKLLQVEVGIEFRPTEKSHIGYSIGYIS